MQIFYMILSAWTGFWMMGMIALHRSEYGANINWLIRAFLFLSPLFIMYAIVRNIFGIKTKSDKIAKQYKDKYVL